MRTTFTYLLLLFFVCVAGYSHAQNEPSGLKGQIFNEAYIAAEAATITLLRYRDSLYIKATTSSKNGLFGFSDLKPDTYIIQITKTGYHKIYAGPYIISANKTVIIDSIKLRLAEVNLKEVSVTEKRKYYEVGPDKTVLNIDRSILATGSSALTILSTAPGVKVNNDGEVTLRGNLSASIFVNGKRIRLEGDDLASYLQNLQAANVEQIELINNPSAKYEAAGSGGVINIILKKGKNMGFNGTVTGNADYGKYGKAGTTFTGNYRSKKIDVFGNATYKYVKTDRTINYLRNIASTNYTTIDTRYNNTQRTPTLTYSIGADYFISPKHTIGFLIKGTAETSRFDKQTKTNLYINRALNTETTTLSNLKRSRDLISYNLNYAGTLGDTKQTINADADVSILNRNAEEDITSSAIAANKSVFSALIPPFSNATLHNQAPTRYVNESVKVDYGNPLTKMLRVDAGVKFSYIKNDNNQEFTMLKGDTYQPVHALTSQFNYAERNLAAYINTNGSSGKFSYNAGLRFENIVSSANTLTDDYNLKRNYNNLYPSVQLNYQLKESQLTLDYNRRTTLPAYDNLNPIISYQDNYTYRMGNAYLRPDYTNKFQLTYTGKTKYQVALFASLTSDFFNYSYFSQDNGTKLLRITRMNLKRMNNYGVNLNIPVQFTKWWDANLYADGSYYQFKDFEGFLNKWSKDINLNLDQNFAISKTLSATLHAEYESGVFYGIYYNKPVYSVAPGISKQLFNNAASINLTVFDVFNTLRGKINVQYKDLDIATYDKAETQIAHLSFVYKFGKRTVKGARKHVAGNSDEQKRMSGSN